MSLRTLRFSVRAASPIANTVIGQIAAAMPPGTYSYQLADPAWRWLAETHPARPAGNQTFNDPVDHWGLETTAVIRDADPLNARRWHESYNNLPANSRQLLCGLGGPSQSYWDSTAHEWLHIAGTTGSADTTHGLMRYRAETDTFSKYSGRGYLPEGGLDRTYCLWPGRGGAHNFSGCSFDPVRRRLYRVLGQHNVGIGSPVQVCYADLAGMNTDPNNRGWLGTLGPEIPSNLSWPQSRFAPDRGPMGQIFCLFTSSGMTTPKVFDVATQSWSSVGWSSTFPSPPAGNDPVNDTTPFVPRFPATIYYEGYDYIATLVDGENQTWRVPLPANPSATDGSDIPPPEKNLAPCPVAMDASGYATGTHTNLTAMNGKIYAFHNDQEWDLENPVRDGGVFAYTVPTAPGDPGSWARVGDIWDESLRALLETQGTSLLDPAPMDRASYQCTAAAIPELGVVLIIWQPYSVHAVGFLWKPPVGG